MSLSKLTTRTALTALTLLTAATAASSAAQAACYSGEGLGYISGYPWQAPSAIRKGGFFSNFAPHLETGNSILMYRKDSGSEHKRWSVTLERNGHSIDWSKSTFEERSRLLQGDTDTLIREVTFRQTISEIAADGSEKQIGQTSPLRAVYFFPLIVGHKYAEKHGACPRTEVRAGTTPVLNKKQTRIVRSDESCVLTVDHTDVTRKATEQRVSFPLISGSAWTSYIDALLESTKNDKGERVFSKEQASEYMDSLHKAFLTSIEKLAVVETDNSELEADEKILATKLYNCRYERQVEGVDEAEFVKRVFGK